MTKTRFSSSLATRPEDPRYLHLVNSLMVKYAHPGPIPLISGGVAVLGGIVASKFETAIDGRSRHGHLSPIGCFFRVFLWMKNTVPKHLGQHVLKGWMIWVAKFKPISHANNDHRVQRYMGI